MRFMIVDIILGMGIVITNMSVVKNARTIRHVAEHVAKWQRQR